MKNYWLSEYNDSPDDDAEDSDIESNLSDRQKMMYEHYEHVVEEFGLFDKSTKSNGSHYVEGSLNPFIKNGMICSNCVFYLTNGKCEIVRGTIDPNAICKLWIIPDALIK